MADKIVFDIETKTPIPDFGEGTIEELEVSVVGMYSYDDDEYSVFMEEDFPKLEKIMKNAGLLIGFSSKGFDVPVLNKYFKFNLAAVPHYDILEEIKKSWGRRISLGLLGEANLGLKKTGHGLEASEWWEKGEIEKLKEYCKQDVKITKEIFDLIRKQGHLWIPQRNTPEMGKVVLEYIEREEGPQEKLFG